MTKKMMFSNLYIIKKLFIVSPGFVFAYFLKALFSQLPSYVCNVLFLKIVLNALEQGDALSKIPYALLLLACFLILVDFYQAYFSEYLQPMADLKFERYFFTQLFQKSQKISMLYFDNPEYYNKLIFSSGSIVQSAKNSLVLLCDAVACVVNIILVLMSYKIINFGMLAIMMASVLITMIIKIFVVKLTYNKDKSMVETNRKISYFSGIFFQSSAIKERKCSDIDKLLEEKYDKSVSESIKKQKIYGKKLVALQILQNYFSEFALMQFGLIVFLLVMLLVQKTIQLSDFVPIYNGAFVIGNSLKSLFGNCISRLIDNSKRIQDYRSFMSLENEDSNFGFLEAPKEPKEIMLRNVSFSYPNCNFKVLDDVNILLTPKKKIALVGCNGAGKSTLASLLMGLYFPDSGEILLDGTPFNAYNIDLYRRSFNSIFQNESLFNVKVGENISLDTDFDEELVNLSLNKAGLSSDNLCVYPDTYIGKEYFENGVILSGGETQKILLARCYYRNCPYIVLDEPSAALDAKAEYEFNKRVLEIVKDKTVLFITHRLTTTVFSDYIYVLDQGKIVQQGTFSQLKDEEGLFKKMWKVQSEKYNVND